MGAQKQLAAANKDLEAVRKLIDGPAKDMDGAKIKLAAILKSVDTIATNFEAKSKIIKKSVNKLSQAVQTAQEALNKRPEPNLGGALDAIDNATESAEVADKAIKKT